MISDTTETLNGWTYNLAAEVGLLTRNVRITGGDYPDIEEESFGARVLVSKATTREDGDVIVRQGKSTLTIRDRVRLFTFSPAKTMDYLYHKDIKPTPDL